jgi:uncharacterized protein
VLRRLLRLVVFEHFPVATGLAFGFAQAVLAAWAVVLLAGPASVPWAALVGAGALLALGNAWLVPRLGEARPRGAWAGRLGTGYVGLAFGTIAVAGGVAGVAAALLVLSGLLAFVGLAPGHGLALFRVASVGAATVIAATLAWAASAGRGVLEVSERRLEVPALPPALDGLRIVHLSDLHIGNGLHGEALSTLVERVVALAPDLVAITGDLFDYDPDAVPDGARRLGALRARLGVFAVLGNHDDDRDMPAALARRGVVVLRDTRTELTTRGERLDLIGIRFWTRREADIAALLRGAGPARVLLAHDPRRFEEATALGIPLVLSGHTHGGQVVLPLIGAPAARKFPVLSGLARRGSTTMFVSRGIGTVYVPVRVACPPEVALLTLRPAPAPAAKSIGSHGKPTV